MLLDKKRKVKEKRDMISKKGTMKKRDGKLLVKEKMMSRRRN